MPQPCTVCGTEIGPRDSVCRVCGTASGIAAGQTNALEARKSDMGAPSPASAKSIPENFLVMPQATEPSRSRQRFNRIVGGCVTAGIVAGVIGWTALAGWRMGPGGEIAYRQHNTEGNRAFERGEFNDADAHYTAMIALRPRRADGYLLRAINDFKMGQYPQSIRDNTSALALTSNTMERGTLYQNRAEAYCNHRKWREATEDFTAAEQAYLQAGNQPGGYTRDDERRPGWLADARRGRARSNFQLKNYASAIADYRANVKAGYIRPEDYGMCATAEAELGQNAQAIADYGKAIYTDAGYMYGFRMLDPLINKTHRYEQAVTVYRQAADAHPEDVFCWGSLGWYEYMAGHVPAATAADEHALSLDADQYWIQYNLGLSYAVAGNSARASKAYAAALKGQDQVGRAASFKELQAAQSRHPNNASLQSCLRQMQQAIAAAPPTPASSANSASSPLATPVDPKFERLLSKVEMRRGYDIRPPAGYTFKHTQGVYLSGTQDIDAWNGPVRPNGTMPTLQVEIIADDGSMSAQASPRQRMQRYLAGVESNHAQFKTSPITSSTMGAQTFIKATWSGIGAKTGRQYDGVVYIASRTGEYVRIECHDSQPDNATSMPILEASARTYR